MNYIVWLLRIIGWFFVVEGMLSIGYHQDAYIFSLANLGRYARIIAGVVMLEVIEYVR